MREENTWQLPVDRPVTSKTSLSTFSVASKRNQCAPMVFHHRLSSTRKCLKHSCAMSPLVQTGIPAYGHGYITISVQGCRVQFWAVFVHTTRAPGMCPDSTWSAHIGGPDYRSPGWHAGSRRGENHHSV